VVKNHVRSVGNGHRIFPAGAHLAHSVSHMAGNGAIGICIRQAVAVKNHTFAGSSLPCNRNIFLDNNALSNTNHPADIKNNRSVCAADSVSEGTSARIIQIGHMIDTSASPAGGPFAESLRAGKCRPFGLKTPDRSPFNPAASDGIHPPVIGLVRNQLTRSEGS